MKEYMYVVGLPSREGVVIFKATNSLNTVDIFSPEIHFTDDGTPFLEGKKVRGHLREQLCALVRVTPDEKLGVNALLFKKGLKQRE